MNIKDLGGLMKHAQELQEKMQGMQDEIANLTVVGEAGAGLVKVTMNGRYEVTQVELDDSLMQEDKAIVEDLVAAACNDGVRRAGQAQKDKMAEVTQGMGLPAGMPFGKMEF